MDGIWTSVNQSICSHKLRFPHRYLGHMRLHELPECQLKLQMGSGLLYTMSHLVNLHRYLEYLRVSEKALDLSEKSPLNEACDDDTQEKG